MSNTVSLIGYHLTFDAEMTTSADMAKFRTTFINGDRTLYTNHEAEEYVDYNPANPANPFAFGDGALTITATPVPAGGHPYTSGLIETSNSFSQNQGYFEIRAQVPNNQGFWPAFWMLNASSYPEIDILEQPNNSGSASKYWTQINTPSDYSGGFQDTGVNLSAGYHAYGFLWNGDTIQFTFDGQLIGFPHSTPPSLVGQQMYLLANLAVGDPYSWPGAPVAGATASYKIDYIRAYSSDPTVPAVALAPISSPDGVDTTPQLGATPQPPPQPQPVTIGTGADTFLFGMAEDAYAGDAQFTIAIDGVQQGGVQTTTASHAAGQSQAFAVKGSFGAGQHTAAVSFLNDAWGGSSAADRNLYVGSVSFNGQSLTPGSAGLFSNGTASFAKAGAAPATLTVGSGADTFLLGVSEDAYAGDAQFTVSVDGVQQGGVLSASASHAAGQSQSVAVKGNFGAGGHTATVSFLNDAYGGNGADRNLYVDTASFNGQALTPSSGALYSNGSLTFIRPGTTPDTLTLAMTEDAYQGDARAEISIDGRVLGQTTVTAANSGAPQQVSFSGDFGSGAHTVGVNFLNDVYGGAGADRNLFVKGITFDGIAHPGATANLFSGGLVNLNI